MFIIVPVFFWLFIYCYLPETKGLTLEEVGKVFGDETVSSGIEEIQSEKQGHVRHDEKLGAPVLHNKEEDVA